MSEIDELKRKVRRLERRLEDMARSTGGVSVFPGRVRLGSYTRVKGKARIDDDMVLDHKAVDPTTPIEGETWLLWTDSGSAVGGGAPIGLLLALTIAGTITVTQKMELCTHRNGTTYRVELT